MELHRGATNVELNFNVGLNDEHGDIIRPGAHGSGWDQRRNQAQREDLGCNSSHLESGEDARP